MVEKLNSFNKLLKTEIPIKITSELKKIFDAVTKALNDAYELALKQQIPGKQLVLLTRASFRSAGYALMIEDNGPENPIKVEDLRACRFWIENFLPRTTKNVDLFGRFLADLHCTSQVCAHFE